MMRNKTAAMKSASRSRAGNPGQAAAGRMTAPRPRATRSADEAMEAPMPRGSARFKKGGKIKK
jgi:hypothetical protein